ncbi:sodium/glutamate symporter [Marinactinospora rubrisoli]|uniref:Sodium/glutamate symporter n=1 Tax=Marinactinospora rubrisoli TaxID=2715399 RepID=A0ABW2KAT0_9ACTN
MEYTPWALLSDAGLIAALLVTGTLVRAHVPIVQRLMLPASVIAGFLGLLLGPHVLGVLPFSGQLGTYSSVLIAVVFACLPLTDTMGLRGAGRQTGAFSLYSIGMYALQVGLGMAFALLVLAPVWDTPDGFGILLVGGWAGGFGSAAALSAAFGDTWPEAASLGFASATVGMLVGIIGGIAVSNWGVRRGHTARGGGLAELPEELRTGLVRDPERRPSLGTATSSASSIEPLALQLCVVGAVAATAYGIQAWFGGLFPRFTLPVFALAFVTGLLLRLALRRTPAWGYLDPATLRGISGTATDVLIVCGIASIVPGFVQGFWLPLVLLFVLGLALCFVLFRVVAPAMFSTNWFEKAVFTWGWSTGAVATSIALLRMVDPDLRTRTLEEFGIAYLPLAPLETATIAFAPAIIMAGAGWALGGGWTALGLIALALPWVLGWTTRSRGRGARPDRVPAG